MFVSLNSYLMSYFCSGCFLFPTFRRLYRLRSTADNHDIWQCAACEGVSCYVQAAAELWNSRSRSHRGRLDQVSGRSWCVRAFSVDVVGAPIRSRLPGRAQQLPNGTFCIDGSHTGAIAWKLVRRGLGKSSIDIAVHDGEWIKFISCLLLNWTRRYPTQRKWTHVHPFSWNKCKWHSRRTSHGYILSACDNSKPTTSSGCSSPVHVKFSN